MSIKPWKVTRREYLRPHIRIDTCEIADGKFIEATILECSHWVSILALTPRQEVVLIRQYRHGAGQVIWELPGGTMEPKDASPLRAAQRELLEETGYASAQIVQVGAISPNSASQTNEMYCFLALDAAQAGAQHLDESEEIDVVLVPLDELVHLAQRGELPQAPQVAALFFALAYLKRIA